MKVSAYHNHLKAQEILSEKGSLIIEIEKILNNSNLQFGTTHPSDIKEIIREKFTHKGWVDKVKVTHSRLTINFMKNKCGTCFQLGNVARTYADILKLMQLHHKKVIDVGVIIVPLKFESKSLGKNYARYERLEEEIKLYKEIIKVPLYLMGLSN